MNRKALERVRDRLMQLPEGVVFDQRRAIIDEKGDKLHCCTAGVAVMELVFEGDVDAARRAAGADDEQAALGPMPEHGFNALNLAAKRLGFGKWHEGACCNLFRTQACAKAADAAAAIQAVLDDPECNDPWKRVRESKKVARGR